MIPTYTMLRASVCAYCNHGLPGLSEIQKPSVRHSLGMKTVAI